MSQIWKETGFVAGDAWVVETEERKAGEGEKAVLGLEAFLAAAAETNEAGYGVLITPADDVRKLEPYLDRIALIAVAFPAFNDGRGFSHAALLRERFRQFRRDECDGAQTARGKLSDGRSPALSANGAAFRGGRRFQLASDRLDRRLK
jgi:hypothetical protein